MLQISSFKHSPDGMRGVESIGFELNEQLPDGVDHVFCPAGGGGLCVAVARGFGAVADSRDRRTAVHCVQPEGNDTIATPLRRGDAKVRDVACSTRISGLQVASVVDGDSAISECRPTGGTGHRVTDEQVWDMQRELAREEGIFCEPAGAVAIVGALNAAAEGLIPQDASIACLVTGVGFKDEDSVTRMLQNVTCPLIEMDQLQDEVEGAATRGYAQRCRTDWQSVLPTPVRRIGNPSYRHLFDGLAIRPT